MRKNRFLLSALFLIYLLIPVLSEVKAGSPKLNVSEKEWDWGRIPQNSVVSHSFWLKNVGTDTLRSMNVSVG
ncbi:MAG: hypothetical protein V1890_03810 [Candidatus Zixiibacteriota bacterium]